MRCEWDAGKEEINQRQHGISFEEAKELFTSGLDYFEIYDAEHSYEEDRFIAVGLTRRGLIVVVYTERQEDVLGSLVLDSPQHLNVAYSRGIKGKSHD